MKFIKQNAGLLRSTRSWGVLGLLLALVVFVQNAQTQDNPSTGIIPPGLFIRSFFAGGALILGNQGQFDANPAYGFYQDSGLGMFRPAANTLAFATGTLERMRIGPGGWVAIGALLPSVGALLTVDGSITIRDPINHNAANISLFFGQENPSILPAGTPGEWGIQYWSTAPGGGGLNFWKPSGSTGSSPGNGFGNNYLFLADTGNVGIGLTAPQEQLHIAKNFRLPPTVAGGGSGCDLLRPRSVHSQLLFSRHGELLCRGECGQFSDDRCSQHRCGSTSALQEHHGKREHGGGQ